MDGYLSKAKKLLRGQVGGGERMKRRIILVFLIRILVYLRV